MNSKCITSEAVVAYSQCPRKAFLLMFSEERGTPHDYPLVLEEHRQQNQARYLESFQQKHPETKDYSPRAFKKHEFLVCARLEAESLQAECDVLTRVEAEESRRKVTYQPPIITGTYKVTKEQRTELLFVGAVLGKLQKQLPVVGRIVGMDGKSHRVKLEGKYKDVNRFLKVMQPWLEAEPTEPPALILNQHCQVCQFRQMCREQAKKEDNLSLLARMTPKQMQKYHKRGIFTVRQLSYLFRPRRKRKRRNKPEPVKHSFELQALAIREQKIYVQELPEIERQPVELFLDIEGIPDQDFYYLIGVLVCEEDNCSQYSFWSDTLKDEEKAWKDLIYILENHSKAPIYHYGNYESKVINHLSTRYQKDEREIKERLINLNCFIFGKICFPSNSNDLKDIGNFLNFTWKETCISAIYSIFLRYKWEENRDVSIRQKIIQYNLDDCYAARHLLNHLESLDSLRKDTKAQIALTRDMKNESNFSRLGNSNYVFKDFDYINKSAYFEYQREKIFFRNKSLTPKATRRKFKQVNKYRVNDTVEISPPSSCRKCGSTEIAKNGRCHKVVFDLKFSSSGIKRWITQVSTSRIRCYSCGASPSALEFHNIRSKYGENLKIWIVYQLIALRQSNSRVLMQLSDLFKYDFSKTLCSKARRDISDYYQATYEQIRKRLETGQTIHADETLAVVNGIDSYVWVLASTSDVLYFYSPTRERSSVSDILEKFNGVLISDFYSYFK